MSGTACDKNKDTNQTKETESSIPLAKEYDEEFTIVMMDYFSEDKDYTANAALLSN